MRAALVVMFPWVRRSVFRRSGGLDTHRHLNVAAAAAAVRTDLPCAFISAAADLIVPPSHSGELLEAYSGEAVTQRGRAGAAGEVRLNDAAETVEICCFSQTTNRCCPQEPRSGDGTSNKGSTTTTPPVPQGSSKQLPISLHHSLTVEDL